MILQADALRLPFADQSVDLVIGSPPYLEARTYGIGAQRKLADWIDFMLNVSLEAMRVSRGPVLWVCCGTGGLAYVPGPEGLVYEAYRRNWPVLRPCYWGANKPPAGRRWFSNVIEHVVGFGFPEHFDLSEIATPMKHTSGGAFRQRGKDGARKAGGNYPTHAVRKTAPNYHYVPVGGGMLGHPLAHENEAPYPVDVPKRFIQALVPKGGVVLDPFGGSGSTWQAAHETDRRCIISDIRCSQCELTRRRRATVQPGFAFA